MENKVFSKQSVIVFQNDHFLFFFTGCSNSRIAALDPCFLLASRRVARHLVLEQKHVKQSPRDVSRE